MLALVVAKPGPVSDGLVALLDAAPQVRKVAHVRTADDAWDFVNEICPDITLVHAATLSQELVTFMADFKAVYGSPLLAIVPGEEERQMALAQGADIVVIEGLPASKLSAHLADLLQ